MAANLQKTPLLLRKDVLLVKPAKPTPSDVLSFSTIDNDLNLELLCQTLYVYQSNASNCVVKPDPALVLKDALCRVLVDYYPLAGKLKRKEDGKLEITCTADGVPFLEVTANCELSSLRYFDGIDVETAKLFVFDWPAEGSIGYHPLVLQVTKFACGGFTVGMGLSHSVCDGLGAAQFFRAMAELASGKSEPTVKPVWERERLVGTVNQGPVRLPIDKGSLATSPFLPTTDLLHGCVNVHADSIKRLKTTLQREVGNEVPNESCSFTTLEILGAYVWRSRFRALKQNSNGKTAFCLAMGIRHLLNPPLPAGYYGNAFQSANAVLTGRDLNEWPLSRVAKMIKESKKVASDTNYIWSSINILETLRHHKMKIETGGECTVLTDWRNLGLFEEVDFGWKASANVIPLPWNMFGYVGLCIFLPPCRMDSAMKGGVRVLVTLPRAAMPKFKEEMDALNVGVVNSQRV
ncbi:hypothetical protein RJ639_043267 [Escallonia herrerae]|uniref:Uncharacterized protein n=1 Tax=Escallonia herrerae TaxID=1293975 RepID=A0AA88WCS6_9ASTE|nr:hypothetical protein RJ639_043267 [Escallonia herrerae]